MTRRREKAERWVVIELVVIELVVVGMAVVGLVILGHIVDELVVVGYVVDGHIGIGVTAQREKAERRFMWQFFKRRWVVSESC